MSVHCAIRGLWCAVAVLLCIDAGCTGSLFQSKIASPTTYLLSASVNAAPEIVAADLAVLRPRVRAGLETDRIAVLYPDRRLDYFAGARWSGPLDQVAQDLVVQAFHTGGQLRHVVAESSAFPSGYWLEIFVAAFEAEYSSADGAPTVHVHLLARLGTTRDRQVLATFDVSSRQTAAQNRLTAIVDAYEGASNAALSDLVNRTSSALRVASEKP